MDFISNQEEQKREMLKTLQIVDLMELFKDIPSHLILKPPDKDDGFSEYEGAKYLENLTSKNTFWNFESYLGAGAYEHHVPAIVSAICSKSEFLTSYTSYQAEASQGVLQAIFEFQSSLCALTGMEVANASVYDAASACAEALLMSLRYHADRHCVLVSESIHPHYLEVIRLYLERQNLILKILPLTDQGLIDLSLAKNLFDSTVAGVLIPYNNFFGGIEDVKTLVKYAQEVNALTILCANPLMYGLYASAGELEVDIAVGDCQPLGIPLQYGGPYAGYMACKKQYVRHLPGRIVGMTEDSQGKRGFVLTLQAREQHIRREKATSNICTNQTLCAIASLITLLWYGKEGIPKLALANYQRAHYLKENLLGISGISTFEGNFFNEFCVKLSYPINDVLDYFKSKNILAGLDIGKFYPQFQSVMQIAVTETKSKEQLDRYIQVMKEFATHFEESHGK